MIRAALVLLAVIAGRADAKGLVLAPHVAPIFEAGRTWTFDTAVTRWGDPDMRTKAKTRGKVVCKVASTSVTAKRALAKITCDADLPKLALAGYWVAGPKGLYYIGVPDEPAPSEQDLAELLAQPPLLPAAPKAFEKVSKVEMPEPEPSTMIQGLRASAKAGGWCVYEDTTKLTDGGRVVRCFAPRSGFESGYDDVGGELDRFEYSVRTTAVRK